MVPWFQSPKGLHTVLYVGDSRSWWNLRDAGSLGHGENALRKDCGGFVSYSLLVLFPGPEMVE